MNATRNNRPRRPSERAPRRLNPWANLRYPNAGKEAPTNGPGTLPRDARAGMMHIRVLDHLLSRYLLERGGRYGTTIHWTKDCSQLKRGKVVEIEIGSNALLTKTMDDCATCCDLLAEALQYEIDHCGHGTSTRRQGREICTQCRMDITSLSRAGWFDI